MFFAIELVGFANYSTVQPLINTKRSMFYREKAAGMYSALSYALYQGCNALLESPTGTGKTLCLLCATLAWRKTLGDFSLKVDEGQNCFSGSQLSNNQSTEVPKSKFPIIIYSSRTHSQLKQVIRELRTTNYRPRMGILGSREQMCIRDDVRQLRGRAQNVACHTLCKRRKCRHHLNVSEFMKSHQDIGTDPFDIEDLVKIGRTKDACPYYISRELHKVVDILFAPYNYLIDPGNRSSLSGISWSNAVLIFDEAHNLDSVCADAASFDLPSSYQTACIAEAKECIDLCIEKRALERAADKRHDPETYSILREIKWLIFIGMHLIHGPLLAYLMTVRALVAVEHCRFLAESFVRRDEVSSHAVRRNIECNYKELYYTGERLRDFHNYMVLSDLHILQNFFAEPSNLMKFHLIVDLLSNNALSLLANLVTKGKINIERTRPKMKKIIKNHFPIILSASKEGELKATLHQLCEILRNSKNYEEKKSSFLTPVCLSTLPSIYKALKLLDSMPIFVLIALNRKLSGRTAVPRFPPSKIGYNKKELVKHIRKRCQKQILTLNNENFMPEKLLKAMSTIYLYFKYKTKFSDTFTAKFFSFSIETVVLQNDILTALWSIPKVTSHQMKALQTILGVKLGHDSSSFLNDLKQYLIQYLLECDEMEIPSDVSNVLATLNQSSCFQPKIRSNETIEEETEAILNVSVELNQLVSSLLSSTSPDEKAAGDLASDDEDTKSNDFELIENNYCSNPFKCQQKQKNAFSTNDELESTGDSMPGTSFISPTTSDRCSDVLLSEASNTINHGFVKKLNVELGDKDCWETSLLSTQASKDCRDISIKELCDETSLVSYRLIGHMMNSFLIVEDRDVGVATRRHLTGEASHSITFQDTKDAFNAYGKNVGMKVFMHSLKDLLPFMTERVKREEAKIIAWENLQKAKAEAEIRKKLEMKLEKQRSSSMDNILNKQRSAQKKAEEMRSAATASQMQQVNETSKRTVL